MRTTERFAEVYEKAKWFVEFHNKPVWLMAIEDDYAYSVIKPDKNHIAKGTTANLYNPQMEIIDSICNF